jgi:hypothetical protein
VATIDKDFKVKNGLVVTLGGSFGQPVIVGSPTLAAHAATKQYVDERAGSVTVPTHPEAPLFPIDGELYFNTTNQHISIYSESAGDWIMLATFADTADLRQHIHDTSIDGNGLIVTVFQDAGFYDVVPSATLDAGFYNTTVWDQTFDGGNPIDNFN